MSIGAVLDVDMLQGNLENLASLIISEVRKLRPSEGKGWPGVSLPALQREINITAEDPAVNLEWVVW